MSFNPNAIYNRILEASKVLSGVVHWTPLNYSYTFSKLTGGKIYLKLENLQKIGAFKVRGAYFKIRNEVLKGCHEVIAASSGNHAQGVAYSSQQLGIKATILMPRYTPLYKVLATKSYGANVILYGDTYDDAYNRALEISKERNIPFIHPFEDPDVIAGQGTIGVEIYHDLKDVDRVIVPVGGGGLISGIAIALKTLKPNIKIYGIQPKGASAMYKSFKTGKLVYVDNISTIADGVAVKRPGEETFKIISEFVDDMVLVSDGEIARAIFLLLERTKLVVEPAGALGVAAILSGKIDVSKGNTVVVLSGGNIDMMLLSEIIKRGLMLEGRHIKIKGLLPDKPGQLKKVIDVIAGLNLNIVSIEHERGNPLINPGYAEVIIEFETPDLDTANQVIKKLRMIGFEFSIVSE